MKQQKEDWMNKKWRPAMGWAYITICVFDFIIFPIFFTAVQFWEKEAVNDAFRQWVPITLQSGGLFHMAMGAVLGVTAWSRGQEKIKGVQDINYVPTSEYNTPAPRILYTTDVTPEYPSPIRTGYKGKRAPIEPEYPII
jgi:hypothetical protein